MRKQRFGPAIGFIIGMSALIAAYVGVACYTSQPDPDKICQGVTIDGMDVSGMTKDEAEKKIQSKLDSLASQKPGGRCKREKGYCDFGKTWI